MKQILTARPGSKRKAGVTLQDILGNLVLLYVKAKDYHWNVTGPEFKPLHETFDGIQEEALEWADVIGERMRALGIHTCSRTDAFRESAWFDEAACGINAEGMKKDMASTLKTISGKLMEAIQSGNHNEVTSNILQDLCAHIDKRFYFVNSSI
ncbi:DNA-binding protein [Aeromonas phage BUCT695]|uniref:DNA-binding protein n=1 Tax=Aeromonas phage BUCT695 TaxID=2908630 RepID=UPI00232935DD|nr:DNA-binding protein [Aeromonas phage BUCT695]UIW10538.1 DNA-binding protein [Aeromonas phage BUCT695]